MNIFLRELRANSKSLLIWAVIALLFTLIGFAKFSAYEDNPELLAILNDMPKALIDAMNIRAFNLTTVTGFFGVMFTYFALMLSIAAAMWGSDVIVKEERDKTVEFSLTLPVTRGRLITAKSLAALVNCIALLLLTWGFVLYGSAAYQSDGAYYTFVARSMLAIFIMQLIFLAVGILLGCAMQRYKRVGAVAISILLGTYLISILVGLDDIFEPLGYLSPFTYFSPGSILRDASLNAGYVVLSVGIIAVAMVGAYLTYNRRDLYI
jgi:ABC-2 type transport system permease protein